MLSRLSDRWFFGGLGFVALALVALSLVWPQGYGARSPAPFGHAEVIPDYVKVDEKKRQKRRDALQRIREAQERAEGGIQVAEPEPKR